MPFAFLIVGTVFVVAAVRGTTDQLIALLKNDFTGKGNYVFWLVSILAIGAVGYIPDLKPVSRAFLALVVVVLFLTNENKGGVFEKFSAALGTTQQEPTLGGNVPTIPSLSPITPMIQ